MVSFHMTTIESVGPSTQSVIVSFNDWDSAMVVFSSLLASYNCSLASYNCSSLNGSQALAAVFLFSAASIFPSSGPLFFRAVSAKPTLNFQNFRRVGPLSILLVMNAFGGYLNF
mmetsp:Transcript_48433/g.54898  ORF Transcript_48433/g.54898 Transcript_48433/m.54898 type:complete len:114 (+) Transcript_48433:241-582(+)